MFTDSLQIAGLFDSPWVVAAILIASAVANWLAQRRAQKADQEQNEATPPPLPAEPGMASWEEKLRRMLEAEAQPPTAAPPPLIPGGQPTSHPGLPPALRQAPPVQVGTLEDYETFQPAPENKPVAPPVPRPTPPSQPSAPVQRLQRPRRSGWNLRHPATARQAYMASLVFGPPKGLEP